MKQATKAAKPATPRKPDVRMLTPEEIADLQRDKAETGAKMLAHFKAAHLKVK